MNTFIQQGYIKLTKMTVKDFILCKISVSKINAVLSNFLFRIQEKNFTVSTKVLSSITVFNVDNKKLLPEQQISIFEWVLNDHMTEFSQYITVYFWSNKSSGEKKSYRPLSFEW